jgi:putative ABC transport system permease protein
MIVTARGLGDSMDVLVNDLATTMFRDDLRVDFIEYEDQTVVGKIRSWPGVAWAEGELGLPMTFRKANESYDALAIGLPEGSRLTKLVDYDRKPIRPSSDGGIFGRTLKKRLGLEVGDVVEMQLMKSMVMGKEPKRIIVRVAGFNDEPVGTIAYFRLSDLRASVRGDIDVPLGAVNSVRVLAQPSRTGELKRRMLDMELAGTVNSTASLRDEFNEMMNMMRQFVLAMLGFGAALASVVMFNMVTMNVIEREAEVATMRTLGISRWQIAWMITQENLWLCLAGLIVGLPVGKWMCEAFLTAAQNEEQQELFTFGASIHPSTYLIAILLIVASTLIAQIPSLGRLAKLNLPAIIKRAAH